MKIIWHIRQLRQEIRNTLDTMLSIQEIVARLDEAVSWAVCEENQTLLIRLVDEVTLSLLAVDTLLSKGGEK